MLNFDYVIRDHNGNFGNGQFLVRMPRISKRWVRRSNVDDALMNAKDALSVTSILISFIPIPGVAPILSVLHSCGVAQVRLFPAAAIEALFL